MLYKYCTKDGFDVLENSRLKAARIQNFNDPFELMFGIRTETALEDIKMELAENPKIIEEWKYGLEQQGIGYDKCSVEDILKKVAQFRSRDTERVFNDIKKYLNDKYGIVCLAESMDIIQMWAHYADKHRGIAIGFDTDEFIQDKSALVKVEYKNKIVLFPVTANPDNFQKYEKYIIEVIKRKETNWAYERECRLYANLDEKDTDGNYYFKIPPSSIKAIYIGLRANDTETLRAKSIKRREDYKHLMIFKMIRHEREYKLMAQEIR